MKNLKKFLLDKLRLSSYHRRRRKYNIGEHSYICHSVKMSKLVSIGKYCSIADFVTIGLGNHPIHTLTTSPFIYKPYDIDKYGNIVVPKENLFKPDEKQKKNTIIGNDVWVGYGAFIKQGSCIGDGAIIGAHSVVTRDIPPYAIAAGVPARVIKYRFTPEIIEKLLNLKWWDYPEDFIVNLPFDNIEKCIDLLEKNKEKVN